MKTKTVLLTLMVTAPERMAGRDVAQLMDTLLTSGYQTVTTRQTEDDQHLTRRLLQLSLGTMTFADTVKSG